MANFYNNSWMQYPFASQKSWWQNNTCNDLPRKPRDTARRQSGKSTILCRQNLVHHYDSV